MLLDRGLGRGRPLLTVADNSIALARILCAALYAGVPVALLPATSLKNDAGRVLAVRRQIDAGAVFVGTEPPEGLEERLGVPLLTPTQLGPATPPDAGAVRLVETAHREINPEDCAKIMFTSGSSGRPRGVVQTHAMLAAARSSNLPLTARAPFDNPVYVDWMPWSHAMSGNITFNRVLYSGGTLYIDDGKPNPAAMDRFARVLRTISPCLYSSVPLAYGLLIDRLEADEAFARHFFSNIRYMTYGGAAMPRQTLDRFAALIERLFGERVVFFSAYGATETCGPALMRYWPDGDGGDLGAPLAGLTVKLVSQDDRYELRLRGPNVFREYLDDPEATAAAFDEEGYYRTGDTVRLPTGSPEGGLEFAGRLSSAFKLDSGTWVNADGLRLELIRTLSPLVQGALICGHDWRDVRALLWPSGKGTVEMFGAAPDRLTAGQVRERDLWIAARLEDLGQGRGSSMRVERARCGEARDKDPVSGVIGFQKGV